MIVSVVLLLVMTRSPVELSEVVTAALPTRWLLSDAIRSPTVSEPDDAYVVVLSPALTVIMPPARIPRVDSGVPKVSGAVPVATAGFAEELLWLEELEEGVEPVVDEPVLPSRMFSIAADSWEFTRFKAVLLAILARPLPKLVSAELIAFMTESLAAVSLALCCCCCQ